MNKLFKLLGKLVTYYGFIWAIAGMIYNYFPVFAVGLALITIGCIMHELNEE